jgi:hypothetical protein
VSAPTNTVAWVAGGTVIPVTAAPRTEVLIGGIPQPRVRLDSIEVHRGSAPVARFSAGLGWNPVTREDVRLEDLAALIQPGETVTARLLRGGVLPGASRWDLVLFEGRIGRIEMSLGTEGEALHFQAEDLAAEVLRRRIGGQRIRTAGDSADLVSGLALVFNPDGQPNASPDLYDPGSGDPHTIFAAVPLAGAVAWTLDEAVAYLLAEYGGSDIAGVPSPGEIRSAVGPLVIRDVRLEGRTLGEALEALLELAGCVLTVSAEPQESGVSRMLEILAPGRAPAAWLAHQAVGDRFRPAATSFSDLQVAMHFEDTPRRYVARGDRKVYESTFDLVAAWDDSLATYDPDDFSPSLNPNFDGVRDVFRKWALNEAGEYSQAPYSRGAAPDLGGLFEGAPYVRRHRRFLECLSRDGLGRSFGVYIEVSLDGGTSWERSAMAARVLRGECGIYLTDDPLSPRYLAAVMRGTARGRVTAAIESDACLVAERVAPGAPDLSGRTRHLAVPAGYRYRRVASTSRFHGQTSADVADDTQRLQELVDAAYEADRQSPAPARIEMPYLAMGRRIGERVLGVRGRRLDFARQAVGYESSPVLTRIRWDFAPVPRTQLELE